jgi:2-haloalkanoic acid dehalogenase type II
MAFDTTAIRALSFDCYGTLIDWDGGIRAALRELESLQGCDLERLVREREQAELPLIAGAFRPYSEILRLSLESAATAQGRTLAPGEAATFVATMPRWPAFPDSGRSLRRLATRFMLVILSNVETSVLQASVRLLGAPFVLLLTAEELKSYKPAPKHWEECLRRRNLKREAVLHVAGSVQHDIRPARALGFDCAWINRRGEPAPVELDPARIFPDLASLTLELCGPEPSG